MLHGCYVDTQCWLFVHRVVQLLVDSGADVNVKDDFSSADRVAFRERVSRLRGEKGEEKMRKGRGEKEGRRKEGGEEEEGGG